LDLAEHYNKIIIKFAGNPLTSSLLTSLPPTFLPLTFLPLISLPPAIFKKFNLYYISIFFKRQVNKIITQNVWYKIAFKSYMLTILFYTLLINLLLIIT